MLFFANVTTKDRGATDRLLTSVTNRLICNKIRILGALSPFQQSDTLGHCESVLQLLPNGPVIPITQNLGKGSAACKMDAGALEEAVGILTARFALEGADLIVLNKFGLREAEGHGFRALIADALGCGIPVLLGVSDTHRPALQRFTEGLITNLPHDEKAILEWCRRVVVQLPAKAKIRKLDPPRK
ncbi:MAG: DUF2478 domain-containing protein [Rhodobacteraceae bacterium]|jgi:hypothetical protein|nr:DUF2478 domain-containing protein [Paracoccaceae bacterium]